MKPSLNDYDPLHSMRQMRCDKSDKRPRWVGVVEKEIVEISKLLFSGND